VNFDDCSFEAELLALTVDQCYFAAESSERRYEGSNRGRTVDSLIVGVFRNQMQFVLFINLYKRKIFTQIYH
jgi:hypothetical protein